MAKLFGIEAPKIEPPKPMPDMDSPEVAAARRRRIAEEQQSGGVRSTILSTGGREKLGA